MALYSWFNRKETTLTPKDKKTTVDNNNSVAISSSYQSVWPTTSVQYTFNKNYSNGQLTKLSVPIKKRLPIKPLIVKTVIG